MLLTITISKFKYDGLLEKLPELTFSEIGPDYWIMLPVFEEIEERTGKLIDLGESMEFEFTELEPMQEAISKSLEKIGKKEPEDELILEHDDERKEFLCTRLSDMVNIAIANRQSIICQSTED